MQNPKVGLIKFSSTSYSNQWPPRLSSWDVKPINDLYLVLILSL